MKTILKYLIITITLFTLSTCKKYDEGGLVRKTCKNLFGGNKVGDSKTWKLKLYEVNGIDSTNLMKGANDLNLYNLTFKLTDAKFINFEASSFYKNYIGSVDKVYKKMALALQNIYLTKEDSVQCKEIDNTIYCFRNIFLPEMTTKDRSWYLKKLSKTELIIEKVIEKNYKIILTN